MSGRIRKVLGPARGRLLKYLHALKQLIPDNFDVSTLEPDSLRVFREDLKYEKSRIEQTTIHIRQLVVQWQRHMASLTAPERAKEDTLFKEFEKTIPFADLMNQADAALKLIHATETSAQKIDLEDDDTLNNPDVFTTPFTPTLPGFQATTPLSHLVTPLSMVNLPKLAIKDYHGNPLKFYEFWDTFSTSIDQQPLPPVVKLTYLLSYLRGEAYRSVSGFIINDTNYPIVVDTLKRRFGDREIIRHSLLTTLQHLPRSTENIPDLRKTYEETERILRQLESLGTTTNTAQTAVLIESKFPTTILSKIYEAKAIHPNWTCSQLRQTIHHIISLKETIHRVDNELQTTHNRQSTQRSFSKSHNHSEQTFTTTTVTDRLVKCSLCQQNHRTHECPTHRTPEEVRSRIIALKLFFNCLRSNHDSRHCPSKFSCRHCKRRHHSLLCNGSGSQQPFRQNTTSIARPNYSRQPRHNTVPAPHANEHTHNRPPPRRDNNYNRSGTTTHAAVMYNDLNMHQSTNDSFPAQETTVNYKIDSTRDSLSFSEPTNAPNEVLLMTAAVSVFNPHDPTKKEEAIIFVDPGSTKSYIDNNLVNCLNLTPLTNETLQVSTFGSKNPVAVSAAKVEFGINLPNTTTVAISASSVPYLTEPVPSCLLQPHELIDYDELTHLPKPSELVKPDILLGSDYYWSVLKTRRAKELSSGHHVLETAVGPIISGRGQAKTHRTDHCYVSIGIQPKMEDDLSHSIDNFWKLETIGIEDSTDETEDDLALQQFRSTISADENRYIVKWPMKTSHPDLPDNFYLAFHRLRSNLRRLQTQPDLLKQYNDYFLDLLQKNIIEVVDLTKAPDGPLKHYLPHHPVITPNKATTKLRIVFDASSKRQNSKSLNDCLLRGPILFSQLVGVLLRFRQHRIAVSADIEKAFLQIGLDFPDREMLASDWRTVCFSSSTRLLSTSTLKSSRYDPKLFTEPTTDLQSMLASGWRTVCFSSSTRLLSTSTLKSSRYDPKLFTEPTTDLQSLNRLMLMTKERRAHLAGHCRRTPRCRSDRSPETRRAQTHSG